MSEQPRETAKAHAAYVEYCAMGPGRSLRKLAEQRGRIVGVPRARRATLEQWSSIHHWQERVKQYDAERAEEKRLAREQAREAMNERHAREAEEEQQLARAILRTGAEKGKLNFVAVQLLKNSRDDERKAFGGEEPTKVEVSGKDGASLPLAVFYMPKVEEGADGRSS